MRAMHLVVFADGTAHVYRDEPSPLIKHQALGKYKVVRSVASEEGRVWPTADVLDFAAAIGARQR